MSTSASSVLPSPVEQLLRVFASHLAEVRFPDVDNASLARLVEQTHAAAVTLANAEATVESARIALRDHQEELLRTAHRALAYARVYAVGNEDLGRELDTIALPRSVRRTRGDGSAEPRAILIDATLTDDASLKRRGRPRKSDRSALSLDLPDAESPAAE